MNIKEIIEKHKLEYDQIFKTVIEEDFYLWRKLKRSEYKSIITELNEEYPEENQFKSWAKQDEITKTVLLYPENADEAIEESAGISTVISQDCLMRSGFGAFTEQV